MQGLAPMLAFGMAASLALGALGEGRTRPGKSGTARGTPASTSSTPAQSCEQQGALATHGPADAPMLIRLWVDPDRADGTHFSQLGMEAWIAARELQSQRPEQIRLELRVTERVQGRSRAAKPRGDEVRALFARAVELAGVDATMRALALRSPSFVRLSLDRPDQQARFAKSLGLADDALSLTPAQLDCWRSRGDANQKELAAAARGSSLQFPVFELQIQPGSGHPRSQSQARVMLQDADHRGVDLRARVDAMLQPGPKSPWTFSSGPRKGGQISVDDRLSRTYPDHGVLLGGPGLEHHLLIFADDERNTLLSRPLRWALHARAREPKSLSVQVIAVGNSPQTELLTRRLCAARELKLELPYLVWLSGAHTDPERDDPGLIEALTVMGESERCSESEIPDVSGLGSNKGADFGRHRRSLLHARGLWLDGRSLNESEASRLVSLRAQRSASPLDFFALQPVAL